MPRAKVRTSVHIAASPQAVFAAVADLTRHGEWAANPLKVEAASPGAVAVGSEYRSTARVTGKDIHGILRVEEYEPHSLFSFSVRDSFGQHSHTFTFRAREGGTLVERKTVYSMSPVMFLANPLLWRLVKRPGQMKFFSSLKSALEQEAS